MTQSLSFTEETRGKDLKQLSKNNRQYLRNANMGGPECPRA
jgi:hypothetical protein